MDLVTYVKSLPLKDAAEFRKRLTAVLMISASYTRHLCNGRNKVPSRYALIIEELTQGAVPRYITAPEHYPESEFKEYYARLCKDFS